MDKQGFYVAQYIGLNTYCIFIQHIRVYVLKKYISQLLHNHVWKLSLIIPVLRRRSVTLYTYIQM